MAEVELTSKMIEDIQRAVQQGVPDANDAIVIQYLAAVLGYMVASQQAIPPTEHEGLIQELANFARQVCRDVASGRAQGEP